MTSKVTRRRPETGIDDPGPGHVPGQDARPQRPDPEVPERARRRTFTAKYKLEILAAYDAAADGEKGALLRREGLYSSHVVEWRRAREAGALAALAVPRGRVWNRAGLRRRPPDHRCGPGPQSDTSCRGTDRAVRVDLFQRGHRLVRAARTRPPGRDRSPGSGPLVHHEDRTVLRRHGRQAPARHHRR